LVRRSNDQLALVDTDNRALDVTARLGPNGHSSSRRRLFEFGPRRIDIGLTHKRHGYDYR